MNLLNFSPFRRDVLKVIAFLAMFIDHLNFSAGFNSPWLYLAGRVAFPLFVLVWAQNISGRPFNQAAANRLWLWAFLSWFPYWLAGFPWYEGNILFLFAVVYQAFVLTSYPSVFHRVSGVLPVAAWLPFSGSSYGICGVFFVCYTVFFYTRKESVLRVVCLIASVVFLFLANIGAGVAVSLTGVVLTVAVVLLVACVPLCGGRFIPRNFLLRAYPLHLLLLGVVRSVVQ
ncbi:type-F conjugative transfer system pilin acetylase TraX [Escherichia coli]|nr:type-F conjugative transfer system pilin acetylase TraX [Escherichia coli]